MCQSHHASLCQTRTKTKAMEGKVKNTRWGENVSDKTCISTVPSRWKKLTWHFWSSANWQQTVGARSCEANRRLRLHIICLSWVFSAREKVMQPSVLFCSASTSARWIYVLRCLLHLQTVQEPSPTGSEGERGVGWRNSKNQHLPIAPLNFSTCLPYAAFC